MHAQLSAAAHGDHGVEVIATESHGNREPSSGWMMRLVFLLSPVPVSRIPSIVTNCRDANHTRKYPKKEMDWESLKIAAPPSCMVKMMSFWMLSGISDRFFQLLPK
jgi:hypothetical protein